MLIDTGTGKDKYQTDPVPEGKPIPVEPEDVEIGEREDFVRPGGSEVDWEKGEEEDIVVTD